jgi:hypothetical protein
MLKERLILPSKSKHKVKELFYELNKQLTELNFILGKGTIVDATIKQAQAKPGAEETTILTLQRKEVRHIMVTKVI